MISLVIPVYNVEKYVASCIESCLCQTFTDWEMILVDDGSTDNSLKICEEYSLKDARIKVIHQENKGLSGARNTGIINSKGEYIFFIDSDDCIDYRLLEVMNLLAVTTKSSLIQINLKFVPEDFKPAIAKKAEINIDNDNLIVDGNSYRIQRFNLIDAYYNLDKDNKDIAEDIRLTTTVAWTKLYRRDAFNSLLFPEEVRLHEDQMTSHRRIAEAKGMVFADVPLYYYRQAGNTSLIRTGWNVKRLSILDCYDDRLLCVNELCVSLSQKDMAMNKLRDYIYLRLLVCYFRNYCMIKKNVKSSDSAIYRKDVLGRMKNHLRRKTGKLPLSKKLFFNMFVICPAPFVSAFLMRNK